MRDRNTFASEMRWSKVDGKTGIFGSYFFG